MRILIVLANVPYPLISGGNHAVFSMLKAMSGKHTLHLLIAEYDKDMEKIHKLEALLPEVKIFYRKSWKEGVYNLDSSFYGFNAPMFRFLRYVHESFGRKLHRYMFKHRHDGSVIDDDLFLRKNTLMWDSLENKPGVLNVITEHLKNFSYDIIQTEFIEGLTYVYAFPDNVRKIFVHHELRFTRNENELRLMKGYGSAEELVFKTVKDRELSLLSHFDDIIVLTENDKKILESCLSNVRIHVSPALLGRHRDIDFKSCNKEFVLMGSCAHFPNLDGALWLCREVLPLVRKKMSGFVIYITGYWDTDISRQMAKDNPELRFTDFIDDLDSFVNGKISIVPIRIGSGMRMKIIQSIYNSSPFITTTKGVEGQNFISGEDCIITDDPEIFAGSMARLANDDNLQAELCRSAKEKLTKNYDQDALIGKRLGIYEQENPAPLTASSQLKDLK